MPVVDIQVLKGLFTDEQKLAMIDRVTEAMVQVEGEALRDVTWVRIIEIEGGHWAIGGRMLYPDTVHRIATGEPPAGG